MKQTSLYEMFEIEIPGDQPEAVARNCASFRQSEGEKIVVSAFRKRAGVFAVRFLPREEGEWKYEISLFGQNISGSFCCGPAEEGSHGLVQTQEDHFRYEDGAKYLPFGTTCYAWIYQTRELQDETMETLSTSCFNKIRMLIFPKFMPYNQEEPQLFPFARRADGSWDVNRTEDAFWGNLDNRVAGLGRLGVEADLILFHPYDRWGFSEMCREDCLAYLDYMVARYGAYRNVWWSLANEYEMLTTKTMEDWDAFGERLRDTDPYHHLISVHNILIMYPKRDWMSHVSVQSGDVQRVALWRENYGLPVIDDEVGYEGNIEYDWGNLSAFDFVVRCWTVVARGGFPTHGETFHREDEVLWWSKGGKLYGQSEPRMAYLKKLLYELPGYGKGQFSWYQDPNQDKSDAKKEEDQGNAFARLIARTPEENKGGLISMQPMVLAGDGWKLRYFGRTCPWIMRDQLPEGTRWKAELIGVWEMTRKELAEDLSGEIALKLPAKQGMAVLLTREVLQ